jgi:uncharacterized protein YndB with AHSA1/START domain
MTSFDIRLERIVEATPAAAFAHWVDPDAQRRWYAPDEGWVVESEADLRVGGAWRVGFGPRGEELYVEHGTFEEFEPPHRVVYTAHHEYPDGRRPYLTRVVVTFEPHDGGTLLTLLDIGFPSKEQRDEIEGGWPHFLDAFARSLAASTSRRADR